MKASPQLKKLCMYLARYGVQYLVKENNCQSNLLIQQFRITLYGLLPHLSSSSVKLKLVYA